MTTNASDSSGTRPVDQSEEYPAGIPEIVEWARMTGPKLDSLGRHLLITLSFHARSDGVCSPSQETLAKVMNCTQRMVDRMARNLQALGLIDMRKVDIGNDSCRYEYRLTGVDHDWRPTPQDPDQKPSIEAALFTRLRALNKEEAHLEEEEARLEEELNRLTGNR